MSVLMCINEYKFEFSDVQLMLLLYILEGPLYSDICSHKTAVHQFGVLLNLNNRTYRK